MAQVNGMLHFLCHLLSRMADEMELHHSGRIEWYFNARSMLTRIKMRIAQPDWSN